MPISAADNIQQQLSRLDASDVNYATRFVDCLLTAAREANVSDLHLQPENDLLQVLWRRDGVLQRVGQFGAGQSSDVVTRLKVLAELLTYRTDVPQEGRIRGQSAIEMRVSTFPTLHGERAAVRLFAGGDAFHYLSDLGLPADLLQSLTQLLAATSGAILITGPAGSGKSTTAYACLRESVRHSEGRRCHVSLEDPIEVAVPGVAQSQVNEAAGFDLTTGLRSLMRQDPEVVLVGEIRDPATAETVFQASLTGHLVLTTFHAGSAATAISRLSDMGIEPYLLRSGILAILSQRLVRRLCDCKQPIEDESQFLGLRVRQAHRATGCESCLHTGYQGRHLLAEMVTAEPTDLGRAILSRVDARQLEELAREAGMIPIRHRAWQAVEQGLTSPAEICRVLGIGQHQDNVEPQ